MTIGTDVLLNSPFTGTNGAALPSPWVALQGGWTIQSNTATPAGAEGLPRHTIYAPLSAANANFSVDFYFVPDGFNDTEKGVILRHSVGTGVTSNGYLLGHDDSGNAIIGKLVNDVFTSLASAYKGWNAAGVKLTATIDTVGPDVVLSITSDVGGATPLTYTDVAANSPILTGNQIGYTANGNTAPVGVDGIIARGTAASVALASDATAIAAATAALATAIQNAGDAASVATGTGALSTGIPLAGDAQSVAVAIAGLNGAVQLLGDANAIATGAAGLVSWTTVTVASPYTGPGSIFDDRYWTGAAPVDGDLIAYENRGDGFIVYPDGTYAAPVYGSWLVQYYNGTWSLSEVSLVQSDFAGDAVAQSNSTGDIVTAILMAAAAASQAAATGAITTSIDISGAAQSVAAASADITALIQMAGDAQSQALASGTLDVIAAQLDGAAQSIATAQGGIDTGIALGSDASLIAVAIAALNTAINMLADAFAVAVATGSLDGPLVDLIAKRLNPIIIQRTVRIIRRGR